MSLDSIFTFLLMYYMHSWVVFPLGRTLIYFLHLYPKSNRTSSFVQNMDFFPIYKWQPRRPKILIKSLLLTSSFCSEMRHWKWVLPPSFWASLVAQRVKHLPAAWETCVQSLGWEDPLEKKIATYSSILTSKGRGAWRATDHRVAKNRTRLSN